MSVQSIDRALEILSVVAVQKDGMRIVDISDSVDLSKSTVHRLLNSLAKHEFIEKSSNNMYKIGPKIVELASIYLNSLELKTEAYPYLQQLANTFGRVSHLAILQDDEAIYIDKISSISFMRMYSDIGKRIPLHCTAVGKVLLSGIPNKQLKIFLSKLEYTKYTSKTLTDAESVYQEVLKVRDTGVAFDSQEHEDGIVCVAAPIYDYLGKVIAAFSVSGIHEEQVDNAVNAVKQFGRDISKKFGYIKDRRL